VLSARIKAPIQAVRFSMTDNRSHFVDVILVTEIDRPPPVIYSAIAIALRGFLRSLHRCPL